MATDPFLQGFCRNVNWTNGCSASTELFPDSGYAERCNIYQASKGCVYVVGQYDARVIDPLSCRTSLSEFRPLDREGTFIGSFDQDENNRWTYVSASQRLELPFQKR